MIAHINMGGDITLHARISIDFPRPADVIVGLEDDMVDEFLKVRVLMLDLMGKYQAREAGSNSGDTEFAFLIRILIEDGSTDVL